MVIFAFFVLDSLSPQELPASQNKHKSSVCYRRIFLILTAPLTEFGLLRTQVIPIPRIPGDPPGEDTLQPLNQCRPALYHQRQVPEIAPAVLFLGVRSATVSSIPTNKYFMSLCSFVFLDRRITIVPVLLCSSAVSLCRARGTQNCATSVSLIPAISKCDPRSFQESFPGCSFARNKCSSLFLAFGHIIFMYDCSFSPAMPRGTCREKITINSLFQRSKIVLISSYFTEAHASSTLRDASLVSSDNRIR